VTLTISAAGDGAKDSDAGGAKSADDLFESEMAELLNRPEASVRSALYRAKAHARKIAMERKDELF